MLKLFFLNVGHGDCTYLELPNGCRMMIDCGGGSNNWPSKLLNYYKVNKTENPVPTNTVDRYGLDSLVISHPHGDHLNDIVNIHDDIGFYSLYGGYSSFIDNVSDDTIDWRKRGKSAAQKFRAVVRKYTAPIAPENNRVALARPDCFVEQRRFISHYDGVDLNHISYLVAISYKGQKVLFSGDLTADAVTAILASSNAGEFKNFVKGTTVLKVPHHGRDNGCSEELFNLFGNKPLVCIVSDETLCEQNEGTSNTDWYTARTSDTKVVLNGVMSNRKVLTTRSDKDIFFSVSNTGEVAVQTNCFKDVRSQILQT